MEKRLWFGPVKSGEMELRSPHTAGTLKRMNHYRNNSLERNLPNGTGRQENLTALAGAESGEKSLRWEYETKAQPSYKFGAGIYPTWMVQELGSWKMKIKIQIQHQSAKHTWIQSTKPRCGRYKSPRNLRPQNYQTDYKTSELKIIRHKRIFETVRK